MLLANVDFNSLQTWQMMAVGALMLGWFLRNQGIPGNLVARFAQPQANAPRPIAPAASAQSPSAAQPAEALSVPAQPGGEHADIINKALAAKRANLDLQHSLKVNDTMSSMVRSAVASGDKPAA